MIWVRVNDLAPYIKSEDLLPPEQDKALVRRIYSERGKKYPIMCITIRANIDATIYGKPITGIRIGVSSKDKERAWWDEWGDAGTIPLELIGDLYEMIEEAKVKAFNVDN